MRASIQTDYIILINKYFEYRQRRKELYKLCNGFDPSLGLFFLDDTPEIYRLKYTYIYNYIALAAQLMQSVNTDSRIFYCAEYQDIIMAKTNIFANKSDIGPYFYRNHKDDIAAVTDLIELAIEYLCGFLIKLEPSPSQGVVFTGLCDLEITSILKGPSMTKDRGQLSADLASSKQVLISEADKARKLADVSKERNRINAKVEKVDLNIKLTISLLSVDSQENIGIFAKHISITLAYICSLAFRSWFCMDQDTLARVFYKQHVDNPSSNRDKYDNMLIAAGDKLSNLCANIYNNLLPLFSHLEASGKYLDILGEMTKFFNLDANRLFRELDMEDMGMNRASSLQLLLKLGEDRGFLNEGKINEELHKQLAQDYDKSQERLAEVTASLIARQLEDVSLEEMNASTESCSQDCDNAPSFSGADSPAA